MIEMRFMRLLKAAAVSLIVLFCVGSIGGGTTVAKETQEEFTAISEVGGPRVFVSQGGYHPEGTKEAVVWTWGDKSGGTFALCDSKSGKAVFSGELSCRGEYNWGGYNWAADFSDWHEEGTYYVEVTLPGTGTSANGNAGNPVRTTIRSPEFPINRMIYAELAQKAMTWFYYQRCGFAIPGWSSACHLDDGVERETAKDSPDWGKVTAIRDATGGWHDAGDYNKWFAYGWIGIYGLTVLWENLRPNWENYNEGLPDPLAEARREVELLVKVQNPDGTLPEGVIGWHPNLADRSNNPWGFWGRPYGETDNQPNTGDERLISQGWVGSPHYIRMHAWIAAALARFAVDVMPFDRELAERSAAAAQKIVELYGTRMRLDLLGATAVARNAFGGLLVAELYLDRFHGTSAYRDSIREIAATLSEQSYLWGDGQELHWPWMEVLALFEYVKHVEDSTEGADADLGGLKLKLESFVEQVYRLCNWTSFGQMPAFQRMDLPYSEDAAFPGSWQGYNPYYAGTAYLLAVAAEVLHRPEFLAAAEHQISWILGRNPLGVSMMVGVGAVNPGIYHTRYSTLPGCSHGRIPGGVVNGMLRIENLDDVVKASGDTEKASRYPRDYPVLAIQGVIGSAHWWRTNEYWIPNNGWFILAASELYAARRGQGAGGEAIGNTFDLDQWKKSVLGVK